MLGNNSLPLRHTFELNRGWQERIGQLQPICGRKTLLLLGSGPWKDRACHKESVTLWSGRGSWPFFAVSLALGRINEFQLRLGVSFNSNRCSRQLTSLRIQPFIITGENSGSALWWGNVSSFLLEGLKFTRELFLHQRRDQLSGSGQLYFWCCSHKTWYRLHIYLLVIWGRS